MKRLMIIFSVIAILFSMSFAAFSDEVEAPTSGTIKIKTNQVTILNEDGTSETVDYYKLSELHLYKIFTAEPAFDENGDLTGIVYKCTDSQKELIESEDPEIGGFFSVSSGNTITATDKAIDPQTKNLSQGAVNWIRDNLKDLGTVVSLSQNTSASGPKIAYDAEEKCILMTDLSFGYYYIDDDAGAAVMIDSTAPVAEIVHKNEVPELEKRITGITNADNGVTNPGTDGKTTDIQTGNAEAGVVSPSGNSKDAHVATVQVGDIVDYEVKIVAKKGAKDYVFADTKPVASSYNTIMPDSDGLTFLPDSVKIEIQEEGSERKELDENNYILQTYVGNGTMSHQWTKGAEGKYTHQIFVNEGGTSTLLFTYENENKDFPTPYNYNMKPNIIVVFKQEWLDTIGKDDKNTNIYITYQFKVNENFITAWKVPWMYPYNYFYSGLRDNMNAAGLTYGRSGLILDEDALYSARLKIYKYEGDGTSFSSGSNPLNGVKFILKNKDNKYLMQDDDDKEIHWVDEEAQATEFITGGTGSPANQQTNLQNVDYINLYNNYSYMIQPNPGPDGEPGTADDYYEWARTTYSSSSYYYYLEVYKAYVGPDKTILTGDDTLTKECFGLPPEEPNNFVFTSGADQTWNTNDDVNIARLMRDGMIIINNLTNGTYTIIEKEGLPGYSKAKDETITINNQNNTFEELNYQVNVVNKMGSVLPSTGGSGTTIIYVIGTMLLIGSGVILNERKRKRAA